MHLKNQNLLPIKFFLQKNYLNILFLNALNLNIHKKINLIIKLKKKRVFIYLMGMWEEKKIKALNLRVNLLFLHKIFFEKILIIVLK